MIKINFAQNKKIGIAVSGGVDSMVLLHIALKQKTPCIVINIDHGIRGTESAKDSQFVKDFCEKNAIECLSYSIDVLALKNQTKDSIELSARKARYEIFYKLLKQKKVDVIALGHHQNDQTETILMRAFRGTGIRGLRGIVDNNSFIHPLLPYTKKDIIDYATQNKVDFREDSTNLEEIYTRNIIRNSIIPSIEEIYPSLNNSLLRLSENCSEIDDFIQSKIIHYKKENDYYYLPLFIKKSAPIIIKYSISHCLRAQGIYQDIESKHYKDIIELLQKENNKKISLPCGITVSIEYDKLVFSKSEKEQSFEEVFDYNKTYNFNGYQYKIEKTQQNDYNGTFDLAKLPKKVLIRTRKDGDRFKACNGKTKLLSDYLQDKKIPLRERDNLLLLAVGDTVYSVLGIEISDLIKIDKNSSQIYRIERNRNV